MSSSQEEQSWLVCPICHKANPAGTKNCKYCWGAGLEGQKPVADRDLAGVLEHHRVQTRRRKRNLRIIVGVASAVLAALILIPTLFNYTDVISPLARALNSNSAPGDWAMFRHDLLNTGAIGNNDVLPTGTIKWTFQTGDAIHSSAAVVDGTVYFGSRNGKLYALDAETGTERWEFQAGSRVESSPAVVGGRVFFGSNDGYLYALDAGTGAELWKFRTQYPIISSPAVAGGKVFFGADDYSVYALDVKNGKKIWKFDAKGPVEASPVVSGGLVYVGSGNTYAYVLNANTGRARLRFKMYDATYASPAIVGTTAYAGNFQGDFYAFDGDSRNWPLEYELKPYWIQIWAFGLAPHPPAQSGFLWGIRLGGSTSGSPVVSGQSLYIGVGNNLTAVDLQGKQKTWAFATDGAVRSTPALAGNTLFVGSGDGHVYAVNSSDGQEIWNLQTGDQITASPTLSNGVLFIGSHDGTMYAIE